MTFLSRIRNEEGMNTLQQEVSRLLGGFMGDEVSRSGRRSGWVPAMDVVETPEAVLVIAEIPGISPADLDISVTGDYLEIRGDKPDEELPEKASWYRFERTVGSFRRTLYLPVPVDAQGIEAEESHGLLTIRLPKKPEVLPRKIEVKAKAK